MDVPMVLRTETARIVLQTTRQFLIGSILATLEEAQLIPWVPCGFALVNIMTR